MSTQKRVLVIGGGPAGIEAAKTAARHGAQTTLISEDAIGGRAGWDSLLPSKVWLTAAERAGELESAFSLGFFPADNAPGFNPPDLLSRLNEIKASWNSSLRDELEALQIDLVTGLAFFISESEIEVVQGETRARRSADVFIVASGSVPWFPDRLKPDGWRVLAPRFASHLKVLPRSAVVIGGGPTGSEFAFLFNRLGVKVTWVVDHYGVLPIFHPDSGKFLADKLIEQGLRLVAGRTAVGIERSDDQVRVDLDSGETLEAEIAFVAIGRKPDWQRLNFPAAGISATESQIVTDGYGRVGDSSIYLVGDADGSWMIANKAMEQGVIAARHALGLPATPYDPRRVLLATYTEPQVAQIGDVTGSGTVSIRVPFSKSLKANLLAGAEGYIELWFRPDERLVMGGVAVGPHAAEVLTPLAVALSAHMTLDQLASIFSAHPTLGELVFIAARSI